MIFDLNKNIKIKGCIFFILIVVFIFNWTDNAKAVYFGSDFSEFFNTKALSQGYAEKYQYENVNAKINKTAYKPGETIVFSITDRYFTSGRPIDIRNDPQFKTRTADNWKLFDFSGGSGMVYVTDKTQPAGSRDLTFSSALGKQPQPPILAVKDIGTDKIWATFKPSIAYLVAPQCTKPGNTTYYVAIIFNSGKFGNYRSGDIPFILECPDQVFLQKQESCKGPDGLIISEGTSRYYYSKNKGTSRECLDSVEPRVCNKGVLSGTAMYVSCPSQPTTSLQTVSQTSYFSQTGVSCVGPDGLIISNKGGRYYYLKKCGTALQCYYSRELRRCNNGVLSGTAVNTRCSSCSSI